MIGVDDDRFGQRLAAFVVRRHTASKVLDAEADRLRRHVKDHLAGFKVPRDVHFTDELPRNATGKVLKRSLVAVGADRKVG